MSQTGQCCMFAIAYKQPHLLKHLNRTSQDVRKSSLDAGLMDEKWRRWASEWERQLLSPRTPERFLFRRICDLLLGQIMQLSRGQWTPLMKSEEEFCGVKCQPAVSLMQLWRHRCSSALSLTPSSHIHLHGGRGGWRARWLRISWVVRGGSHKCCRHEVCTWPWSARRMSTQTTLWLFQSLISDIQAATRSAHVNTPNGLLAQSWGVEKMKNLCLTCLPLMCCKRVLYELSPQHEGRKMNIFSLRVRWAIYHLDVSGGVTCEPHTGRTVSHLQMAVSTCNVPLR